MSSKFGIPEFKISTGISSQLVICFPIGSELVILYNWDSCVKTSTGIPSHLVTCFPIGSGLVIVVLKNPSHSNRPYSPAQLLCLFPVCGKHHGTSVLNCRSAGSQGRPSAHEQTPRSRPFEPLPFFLS